MKLNNICSTCRRIVISEYFKHGMCLDCKDAELMLTSLNEGTSPKAKLQWLVTNGWHISGSVTQRQLDAQKPWYTKKISWDKVKKFIIAPLIAGIIAGALCSFLVMMYFDTASWVRWLFIASVVSTVLAYYDTKE